MTSARGVMLPGRVLGRNAALNFAGLAVPVLAGLVVIPLLIRGMGTERFGILAIVWVGTGYFALFDVGIGHALTQAVAQRLGTHRTEDLRRLVWAAIGFILCAGTVTAAVVFLAVAPLVERVLNVDPALRAEAAGALRLLALGIPVITLTKVPAGLLAAHQRFGTIAAIRIAIGVLRFAAPVVTLQFTPSLVPATAALMAMRLLALIVFSAAASGVRPELKRVVLPRAEDLWSLLQFGGWLTVTQVVRPFMLYFDRFLIGATLGMTMLTYYVTPYEVVSRVRMLPQSIVGVLFPALATTMGGDRKRLPRLYRQFGRVLLLLVLPATSAVFLLAPEALQYWLGEDFRGASTPVAHWLAVAWSMTMQSRPASTLLESSGRPDLPAKASAAMLLPYILLLWWLTTSFGIVGTAAGWLLLVLGDAIVLNELVRYTNPDLSSAVTRNHLATAALLVGFGLAWLVRPLWARGLLWVLVTGVCGALIWPLIGRLARPAASFRERSA